MADQTGPAGTARRIARELPDIRYTLERLPTLARRLVEQLDEHERTPPPPNRRVDRDRERRQFRLLAGAAGLVAGALLIGLDADPAWLGWLLSAAGLLGLWLGRPPSP